MLSPGTILYVRLKLVPTGCSTEGDSRGSVLGSTETMLGPSTVNFRRSKQTLYKHPTVLAMTSKILFQAATIVSAWMTLRFDLAERACMVIQVV